MRLSDVEKVRELARELETARAVLHDFEASKEATVIVRASLEGSDYGRSRASVLLPPMPIEVARTAARAACFEIERRLLNLHVEIL